MHLYHDWHDASQACAVARAAYLASLIEPTEIHMCESLRKHVIIGDLIRDVACRYVDYLLEAVSKRELFGLLKLEPEKWWHSLLFRDRYNMLGIAASHPAGAAGVPQPAPGRPDAGAAAACS